jgi:hypothetical protein
MAAGRSAGRVKNAIPAQTPARIVHRPSSIVQRRTWNIDDRRWTMDEQ